MIAPAIMRTLAPLNVPSVAASPFATFPLSASSAAAAANVAEKNPPSSEVGVQHAGVLVEAPHPRGAERLAVVALDHPTLGAVAGVDQRRGCGFVAGGPSRPRRTACSEARGPDRLEGPGRA